MGLTAVSNFGSVLVKVQINRNAPVWVRSSKKYFKTALYSSG